MPPRSSWAPASYLADEAPPASDRPARRPDRPLRLGGPLRPPQDRPEGDGRGALKARRLAGPGPRRRQRHRRSGRRAPRRDRVVGQERQPPAPRPRELVRARVRGHRRAACRRPRAPSRTGAGRAAAASTGARPARSPRQAWSTRAVACPGCCRRRGRSRRAPRRARRPHLRVRRVPGGVPAEPAGARCGPDRATRSRGPTWSTLLDPDDDVVLERAHRWYIPGATSATCAGTRSWCSATSATADDPVVVGLLRALPRARRPVAAGPRRLGGAAARTRGSPPADRAGDRSRRSSPSDAAALR